MKPATFLFFGISCFILGILFVLVAFLGPHLIDINFKPGILKKDIVSDETSKKSQVYQRWVRNDFKGAPHEYEGFYFYNLTNFDAVLNKGAKPIFDEIGPYVYREYHHRINVTFSDHGNLVTYWDYAHFILDEKQSIGDPKKDVIYNLNPAYLGAIEQAGSDIFLTIGFTGSVLQNYLSFLTEEFVEDYVLNHVPTQLKHAQEFLSGSNDEIEFLEKWANSTHDANYDWEGMLVSYQGKPSNISILSAKFLFDPLMTFSLMDDSFSSSKMWRKAIMKDPRAIAEIEKRFFLTEEQVNMLSNWLLNQFQNIWVLPYVEGLWNVKDISDLGYLQWGEGILAEHKSVKDLYPEKEFIIQPEYSAWWYSTLPLDTPKLDLQTSKKLLNGSKALFESLNVGYFWNQVESENWKFIEEIWGLSEKQCAEFGLYFFDTAKDVSPKKMEELFKKGSGLVTNRTVHQWLWDAQDPLLEIIQPSKSNVRLVVNYTSEDNTLQDGLPSTCFTGKNDSSKVMWYTIFQGMSEITVYPKRYPIAGTTEDGQFQPFLDDYTILHSWNEDYMRNIKLVPREKATVNGINVHIYMIDNSTFSVNSDYYQNIQGFVNLTAIKQSPIFLGNPHFLTAEEKWREKIEGMKPTDSSRDLTRVYVEPYTGKVVKVNKNIQGNIYIPESSSKYAAFYPKFTTGVMYPLFWAWEKETITKNLAEEIKKDLYRILSFRDIMIPAFLPSGIICFLFAIFFIYRRRQVKQEMNNPRYDLIPVIQRD